VQSRPGEGATFYILLPTQACAGATTPDARTSGTTLDGGSETILLVEDETAVRRLAASVLRRAGYTVIETPGGEEALRAASDHTSPIDLVLSDIVMPGMMGPEVSDALAMSLPGVRVLFMSGYPDTELDRRGAVHRHHPFLQKPFTPESLRRKVREVLDGAVDGIATHGTAGSSTTASGTVLPTVKA
jgi:CheY-like chemotaxis protein